MPKRSLRDRFFEANAKLPRPIQKHTDRVIRTGFRIRRKLDPLARDTQRKGRNWVRDKRKKIIDALSK